MIYLTDSAITYAGDICSELSEYKVSVLCKEKNEITRLLDLLLSLIDSDKIFAFRPNQVLFANGSIIRFWYVAEGLCGVRSHLLIADRTIDKEILRQVYMPMETLWYESDNQSTV